MRYSAPLYQLRRQIARRRRDLLRGECGRSLIYPQAGSAWFPSQRQSALCESFVVLFVAELETYWEYIVQAGLDAYQGRFLKSGLQKCKAGEGYIKAIQEKRKQFEKNNNANWTRIGHNFEFIGFKETMFPNAIWDHIDAIVKRRGDIVHNSGGIRVAVDPRSTIAHIEHVINMLGIFDRDFHLWLSNWRQDQARLSSSCLDFIPGLGSIAVL